jgi:hypothetical protein
MYPGIIELVMYTAASYSPTENWLPEKAWYSVVN